MAVVGVDPGGTTGVAVYHVEAPESEARPLAVFQWGDPDSVASKLAELAAKLRADFTGVNVVFVIEQFDKRPGVASPDFTPMFIIRDINNLLGHERIVWQTPSQAKNLVKPPKNGTPDGLKRFHWYRVNMGHANDASRHVITFLVEKIHHMPTILRGWPKRGN